jgi:hypothetical protein
MPGRAYAVVGALALVGGCIDFPGTTEGGPCNSQQQCATGLSCDADGICRSQGASSWELMVTPTTKTLRGVWCAEGTDIIAVGDAGTILRFKGSGNEWQMDEGGKTVAGSGNLSGIWGRSGNDVWVVGSPSAGGGGLILHYNGSSWEKQPPIKDPAKPTQDLAISSLGGVSGSSQAPLYVVGSGNSSGLVLKLDGTWTVENAGLTYSGEAVAVVGQRVFIAGQTKAVRYYDGSAWLERALPGSTQDNLYAVFGWEGWPIVAGGTGSSSTGKLVRFDGTKWEDPAFSALKSFQIYGIWGGSPERYYLAGDGYGTGSSDAVTIMSCTTTNCAAGVVPKDAQGQQMNAVWGNSSAVYAVGEQGVIIRLQK